VKTPLLLLAGTSESGKSTAGAYLATRGVVRVKIRSILTQLTSGFPSQHEGVPTREGFNHAEFVDCVLALTIPDDRPAVAIESFIDATLAAATRQAWPAPCRIVFITAGRANRLHRTAAERNIAEADAAELLDLKDRRKRVYEQFDRWRAIADQWIDNDGSRQQYLADLDHVLRDLTVNHHHKGQT
jgi:hypothetical protein